MWPVELWIPCTGDLSRPGAACRTRPRRGSAPQAVPPHRGGGGEDTGRCARHPRHAKFSGSSPKTGVFAPGGLHLHPRHYSASVASRINKLCSSRTRTGYWNKTGGHHACHDFVRYGCACVVVHLNGKIGRPRSVPLLRLRSPAHRGAGGHRFCRGGHRFCRGGHRFCTPKWVSYPAAPGRRPPPLPDSGRRRPKSQKGDGQNPRDAQKKFAAGVIALRRAHRQPYPMRVAPPAREESGKMPQKQVFLIKIDPPRNSYCAL